MTRRLITTFCALLLFVTQLGAGVICQTTSGVTFTEAGGVVFTEAGGVTFTEAGGVTFTEAGGVTFTEAGGVVFTEAGGILFGNPTGVVFTEAGGVTFTEAGGVTFTEAGGPVFTEAGSAILGTPDGVTFTEAGSRPSIDLELLAKLSVPADTSSINVIVTYRSYPTESDLERLRGIGIAGGTLLRVLPMVMVDATREQIAQLATLANVQSVYANKNTSFLFDATARAVHAGAASSLAETTGPNGAYTGRGVGVAILDTGIDATHPDLSGGQVRLNVEVVSTQGTAAGFVSPLISDHQPNSDLVYGHGTFVAGIVAGSGAASGGRIRGLATGAHLVGVGVGDATLLHVLEGFDAILTLASSQNIRVVNCSFGIQGPFDPFDPVNIATRALHDRGIAVVMAVGNHGPKTGSISPYAVAPWVIGVAGTDGARELASFSSRGEFASALYAPAVAAPAVNITAPRATGTALVAAPTVNLPSIDVDSQRYAVASGTSFATPVVSALAARMLEVNPQLTPAQIKMIVQKTATTLVRYDRSEAGAGVVNYAAALHQTLDSRVDYGTLLRDLYFHDDYLYKKNGAVATRGTIPQSDSRATQTLDVPAGVSNLHVTLDWGPHPTVDDLDLRIYDPSGALRATSASMTVPALFGSRESVSIREPLSGRWTIQVDSKLPAARAIGFVVAQQSIAGIYPKLASFSGTDQKAMQLLIRSRALGSRSSVGGDETIDRATLAKAFAAYGQPKFLPAASSFNDLNASSSRLYPESSFGAKALGGGLASWGSSFDAKKTVSRIEFVRAVVRFSGLSGEAESRWGAAVDLSDAASLSASDRGYAAVAIEQGLVDVRGGKLEPNAALTSLTLARGMYAAR